MTSMIPHPVRILSYTMYFNRYLEYRIKRKWYILQNIIYRYIEVIPHDASNPCMVVVVPVPSRTNIMVVTMDHVSVI